MIAAATLIGVSLRSAAIIFWPSGRRTRTRIRSPLPITEVPELSLSAAVVAFALPEDASALADHLKYLRVQPSWLVLVHHVQSHGSNSACCIRRPVQTCRPFNSTPQMRMNKKFRQVEPGTKVVNSKSAAPERRYDQNPDSPAQLLNHLSQLLRD
jgi:hypothetical protein